MQSKNYCKFLFSSKPIIPCLNFKINKEKKEIWDRFNELIVIHKTCFLTTGFNNSLPIFKYPSKSNSVNNKKKKRKTTSGKNNNNKTFFH